MKHKAFYQAVIGIVVMCFLSTVYSQELFPNDYKTTLKEVYKNVQLVSSGENAAYIPELAKADPNRFAITVVTINGDVYSIGDVDLPFSLQSISKVFSFAQALEDNDEALIFKKIGLDATGEKFNAITPLEEKPNSSLNPYVNAGAIQTTSFIKGKSSDEKWQRVLHLFKALSDGKPFLSERIYQSETQTNLRNHAIAHLLKSHQMLKGDPKDVLDRYTKACSVMVTTKQLALMGATLANNGVNPLTKKQIISPLVTRHAVSQMLVNGLYEKSGTWFVTIGVPAKSGVSGGLLAIIPNRMAIAVYSPHLDTTGTSVRGQKVIQELSERWGLHLLENDDAH
jgi:glutaminase